MAIVWGQNKMCVVLVEYVWLILIVLVINSLELNHRSLECILKIDSFGSKVYFLFLKFIFSNGIIQLYNQ